jgi:hypothetical protein
MWHALNICPERERSWRRRRPRNVWDCVCVEMGVIKSDTDRHWLPHPKWKKIYNGRRELCLRLRSKVSRLRRSLSAPTNCVCVCVSLSADGNTTNTHKEEMIKHLNPPKKRKTNFLSVKLRGRSSSSKKTEKKNKKDFYHFFFVLFSGSGRKDFFRQLYTNQ